MLFILINTDLTALATTDISVTNGVIHLHKIGRVVYFEIALVGSFSANTGINLTTLPAKYRPINSYYVSYNACVGATLSGSGRFGINTSGSVSLYTNTTDYREHYASGCYISST